MLAYLKGKVLAHTKDGAIIQAHELGYEVIGSFLSRIGVDEEVEVYTYQYHENDSIPRLVGCASLEARSLLISLLTVSGVGPKMAGRIVDTMSTDELKRAIVEADLSALRRVKGLGQKTAQKIILELGKTLLTDTVSGDSELSQALLELGFNSSEIAKALKEVDRTGLSEQEELGAVLKHLGQGKRSSR